LAKKPLVIDDTSSKRYCPSALSTSPHARMERTSEVSELEEAHQECFRLKLKIQAYEDRLAVR